MSRNEELYNALLNGETVDFEPRSRNEELLLSLINGEKPDCAPKSRTEAMLLAYCEKCLGGGGGETGGSIAASIVDRSVTEFKDNKITTVGHSAFRYCTKLKTVDLPNVTYIDMNAFGSSGVETCRFDKLVSVVVDDYGGVFEGCKSLTTFIAPALLKTGGRMFAGCSSLTSVTVPKLQNVYYRSMVETGLKTLDLPSCTNISHEAFAGSANLNALILRNASVCTLGSTNAFNNTAIASGTGCIYVPAALVDSYKAATNWSNYADQFRALEDYTVDGTTTGELDGSKFAE